MERAVYKEHGYDSRADYLNSLEDEYGVDGDTVHALADMLGSDEDFDGLVSSLGDIQAGDGGFHGGWDGD